MILTKKALTLIDDLVSQGEDRFNLTLYTKLRAIELILLVEDNALAVEIRELMETL